MWVDAGIWDDEIFGLDHSDLFIYIFFVTEPQLVVRLVMYLSNQRFDLFIFGNNN